MGDHVAALKARYPGELARAWEYYTSHQSSDPEYHLYGALTAWRLSGSHRFRGMDAARAGLAGAKGEVRAKLHFTLGILAREVGDLFVAQDNLTACLNMLDRLPDLSNLLRGAALYNLGLTFYQRGAHTDALQAYHEALDEFRAQGMRDYERQCLQNLAWVATETGDLALAASALSASEPLCETDEAAAVQDAALAYLTYQKGELTGAMRIAERLMKDESNPLATRSVAASVGALVLTDLGRLREATAVASVALDLAMTDRQDHRCFHLASQVWTRLHVAQREAGA